MRSIGVLTCLIAVVLATSAGPVFAADMSVAGSAPSVVLAKQSCTPGYSPCIPNKASDVDCWGGSGNGPRYTAANVTYRVTGSDPYRLDADHDHLGCEPYGR
ncbi:MAG: hypothetical protein QOJ81_1457 [Chloroflexota bacterium]|jgi:hypothetical protein|nr:hypothetical protein [Chloroflexota bacterium]